MILIYIESFRIAFSWEKVLLMQENIKYLKWLD
jgi:hypothetical protein